MIMMGLLQFGIFCDLVLLYCCPSAQFSGAVSNCSCVFLGKIPQDNLARHAALRRFSCTQCWLGGGHERWLIAHRSQQPVVPGVVVSKKTVHVLQEKMGSARWHCEV